MYSVDVGRYICVEKSLILKRNFAAINSRESFYETKGYFMRTDVKMVMDININEWRKMEFDRKSNLNLLGLILYKGR